MTRHRDQVIRTDYQRSKSGYDDICHLLFSMMYLVSRIVDVGPDLQGVNISASESMVEV
jgi:hypothetical protein